MINLEEYKDFKNFKEKICINCSSCCDRSEEFIRQCIEELRD